jgi:ATP-dependent Clp protease protease subunit
VREILTLRRRLSEILASHTGQTVAQIDSDTDRDRYLSAADAKAYGIIDEIVTRGGEKKGAARAASIVPALRSG